MKNIVTSVFILASITLSAQEPVKKTETNTSPANRSIKEKGVAVKSSKKENSSTLAPITATVTPTPVKSSEVKKELPK